jgi:hypothetical protein
MVKSVEHFVESLLVTVSNQNSARLQAVGQPIRAENPGRTL